MSDDELIIELRKLRRKFFRPKVVVAWKQFLHPVVDLDDLMRAEQAIGSVLPSLLRRLYLEVGNGGFGPGYGLIGLPGGATDSLGNDVVSGHLARQEPDPEDPEWKWPASQLALFEWGGAIFSCCDLRPEYLPVFEFDPNRRSRGMSMNAAFREQSNSLNFFLSEWILGKDVALPS